MQNSIKKKSKSENQNASFRSMLCCFGRPKRKHTPNSGKPIQETQTVLSNGTTDHTPPPTPPLTNRCIPTSDSVSSMLHTICFFYLYHMYKLCMILPVYPIDHGFWCVFNFTTSNNALHNIKSGVSYVAH